jgi:hypothetical protein
MAGIFFARPWVIDTYQNSNFAVRHRLQAQRHMNDLLAENILLFNEPLTQEQELLLTQR